MSYTAVQFIGYELFTGPGQYPKRHYVGLDSDREDIAARVALFKEALIAAKNSPMVDNGSNVLKIFMAPEFYFRGARGAYPLDLLNSGGADDRGLVGALTDLIKGSEWADWLVVFGTIIGRSSGGRGRNEVYNVALVQQGSFTKDTRLDKCVVIMKEFMSDIDFLDIAPGGLTLEQVSHLPAMGPGTYALEQNNPGQGGTGGYNGGSIFMLNGITFGLEVCLDHLARRLLRAWPLAGDLFVQVQLIPSGGMSIETGAVATQTGGLVFNVDGLTSDRPDEGYGYHAALKHVRQRLPNDDQLRDALVLGIEPVNLNLNEVIRLFWLPPYNDVEDPTAHNPQLIFYKSVNIPAPEQAD